MKATISQAVKELHDQLDVLQALISAFYDQKQYAVYKSMSVSLRLLLVGSSGDGPLVHEVLPSVALPRLIISPPADMPPDHLCLPARTVIATAGKVDLAAGVNVKNLIVAGGAVSNSTFDSLFSVSESLPFPQWITQPFLRPNWTLLDFVRTIAHKDGGAHFDPNHPQLLAMQNWGHFHWHLTAGLAAGILQPIRSQLASAFPTHRSPTR